MPYSKEYSEDGEFKIISFFKKELCGRGKNRKVCDILRRKQWFLNDLIFKEETYFMNGQVRSTTNFFEKTHNEYFYSKCHPIKESSFLSDKSKHLKVKIYHSEEKPAITYYDRNGNIFSTQYYLDGTAIKEIDWACKVFHMELFK